MDKFYFDGTRLNGCWAIKNKLNDFYYIWIDCEEKYIPTIVKALNKYHGQYINNKNFITIDNTLKKYQTDGVFDKEKFAKEINDFMEDNYRITPF